MKLCIFVLYIQKRTIALDQTKIFNSIANKINFTSWNYDKIKRFQSSIMVKGVSSFCYIIPLWWTMNLERVL